VIISSNFVLINLSYPDMLVTSVFWHSWLGGMKGIQPVKKLSGGLRAWLSVCGKVQICILPSRCHCHSLSLTPVNPDWFNLPGFIFLVPAHPGGPGHIPEEQ